MSIRCQGYEYVELYIHFHDFLYRVVLNWVQGQLYILNIEVEKSIDTLINPLYWSGNCDLLYSSSAFSALYLCPLVHSKHQLTELCSIDVFSVR
jgi:hypothetical protein